VEKGDRKTGRGRRRDLGGTSQGLKVGGCFKEVLNQASPGTNNREGRFPDTPERPNWEGMGANQNMSHAGNRLERKKKKKLE